MYLHGRNEGGIHEDRADRQDDLRGRVTREMGEAATASDRSGSARRRVVDLVLAGLAVVCVWLLLTRGQVLYPGHVVPGDLPLTPFVLLIIGLLARGLKMRRVPGASEFQIERRWEWVIVAVFVALLPFFHHLGGRVDGEGVSFYVYLRSMAFDGDLDFANEYVAFGTDRADPRLFQPTPTGLPRNVHSAGPAVIWSPFFAVGHLVATLRGEGRADDGDPLAVRVLAAPAASDRQDAAAEGTRGPPSGDEILMAPGAIERPGGYGYPYVTSVGLGSIVWMAVAALALYGELRRRVSADVAALAVLATLLAGPLLWYTFFEPSMSHAPAAACLTLAVVAWLAWRRTPRFLFATLVGVAGGLLAMQRWQLVLWLVVPAVDGLLRAWRSRKENAPVAPVLGQLAAMGIAALVTMLPQFYAWNAVWGNWLVNPMGDNYLNWTEPALWQVLLSQRHGLFVWHPILLIACLGLVLAWRKDKALTLASLGLLLATWYVNAAVGDWWGNDAFGQRRFAALYPFFAWGLAAVIASRGLRVDRRRLLAVIVLAIGLNAGLAHGYRTGVIRRDWWVSGLDVVRCQFDAVEAAARGSLRWASQTSPTLGGWLYMIVDGEYIFGRGVGNSVDVGAAGDDRFLGQGWGTREHRDEGTFRWAIGHRATVWLPVWWLRDHQLGIDAWALDSLPGQTVTVYLNGERVDSFALVQPGKYELRVERSFWRRGLNLLELSFAEAAPPPNGDPRPLSTAVVELTLAPLE